MNTSSLIPSREQVSRLRRTASDAKLELNRHASRRRFLGRLLGSGGVMTLVAPTFAADAGSRLAGRSVREFGAVGDGVKLDTRALQAAIDECAQTGGSTVFIPAGRYLTGSLLLKSHVTLHLDAGATLLGSTKLDDYAVRIPATRSFTDNYTERALIYGDHLENVAIEGRGVIDGQGAAFKGEHKVRPFLLRLATCREVAVRDVTLKDSAMWVQHYLACDGVLIEGIRVASACNSNSDGIDIDGCERVRIANCDVRSGDDAIVLKSSLNRPCRNVVITNCAISSRCSAFKLGSETNDGFENIVLSNCAIYDTGNSGIALEMVDGGTLERVSISNVTIHNTRNAIFIRLGNRARPFKEGAPKPDMGRFAARSHQQRACDRGRPFGLLHHRPAGSSGRRHRIGQCLDPVCRRRQTQPCEPRLFDCEGKSSCSSLRPSSRQDLNPQRGFVSKHINADNFARLASQHLRLQFAG